MEVKLEAIRIDGGTQTRPLDRDILVEYTELIIAKTDFPPVETVFDGKDHWLWDGFHRYHSYKKAGKKAIAVNTRNGTQDDAVWLSYSANKGHGFRRQTGVNAVIIKSILQNKKYAKKTLAEIARHVGVTRQYVSQIKTELHVSSSLHIERDEEVEIERGGTTYTQKSQEKQYKPKAELKDSVQVTVPIELGDLYVRRQVIKDLIDDIDKVHNKVKIMISERDPILFLLNTTAFQCDMENLKRTLEWSIPYAVCPYCGGVKQDCKACKGFGFVNKDTYKMAPKELKGCD